MDTERGGKSELRFGSIADQIRDKAHHPSVSGTLIVFLIMDIAMLVIGIMHKDHCGVEPNIAIFLIVGGAVGIISKILPFINRKLDLKIVTYVIYLLYLFEFIWMIVGSVWVYPHYQPNYSIPGPWYCDKTLYLFSFWLLTIRWVLLGLSILLCCCYCLFQSKSR